MQHGNGGPGLEENGDALTVAQLRAALENLPNEQPVTVSIPEGQGVTSVAAVAAETRRLLGSQGKAYYSLTIVAADHRGVYPVVRLQLVSPGLNAQQVESLNDAVHSLSSGPRGTSSKGTEIDWARQQVTWSWSGQDANRLAEEARIHLQTLAKSDWRLSIQES